MAGGSIRREQKLKSTVVCVVALAVLLAFLVKRIASERDAEAKVTGPGVPMAVPGPDTRRQTMGSSNEARSDTPRSERAASPTTGAGLAKPYSRELGYLSAEQHQRPPLSSDLLSSLTPPPLPPGINNRPLPEPLQNRPTPINTRP